MSDDAFTILVVEDDDADAHLPRRQPRRPTATSCWSPPRSTRAGACWNASSRISCWSTSGCRTGPGWSSSGRSARPTGRRAASIRRRRSSSSAARGRARPGPRVRARDRRLRRQAVLVSGAAGSRGGAAAAGAGTARRGAPAGRRARARPAVAAGDAPRRGAGALAEGVLAAARAGLRATGSGRRPSSCGWCGAPHRGNDADARLAHLPAAPETRIRRRAVGLQRVGRRLPADRSAARGGRRVPASCTFSAQPAAVA